MREEQPARERRRALAPLCAVAVLFACARLTARPTMPAAALAATTDAAAAATAPRAAPASQSALSNHTWSLVMDLYTKHPRANVTCPGAPSALCSIATCSLNADELTASCGC